MQEYYKETRLEIYKEWTEIGKGFGDIFTPYCEAQLTLMHRGTSNTQHSPQGVEYSWFYFIVAWHSNLHQGTVQVVVSHLLGTMSQSESMLTYCQLHP